MDDDLGHVAGAVAGGGPPAPLPEVPEWPQFMRGCVKYRQSLDEQAPGAPRTTRPYDR